jgi:hypothetical protein
MTDQKWLQKDQPFTIVRPAAPAQWSDLAALWGGGSSDTLPLQSVIKAVRASGASSVVVENAYPDLDQASEAAYWAQEFALPHIDVYRAHFFKSNVEDGFPLKKQAGYLGYAVVARPLGRLIRAFVKPPPCLTTTTTEGEHRCTHCDTEFDGFQQGALTVASETVELFGCEYELVGIPYCGQDAWHLQCGHAVAWTCLFCAHLQGRAPRTTLRDAIDAGASAEVEPQRAVSATGTSIFQLQRIFTSRGMPALYYQTQDVVKDPRLDLSRVRREFGLTQSAESILGLVCNYLNSGFPVVASTTEHTVTLIGWRRSAGPDGEIELVYSDADEVFGTVSASQIDDQKWKHLMIPLPPEVVLTGETAQAEAYKALTNFRKYLPHVKGELNSLVAERIDGVEELLKDRNLSLRLHLKRRHEYRSSVHDQSLTRGRGVADALAVLRLPGWVWLVEVQDRQARERGEDCVVAEFVFDTTSPDDAPQPAAVSIGGVAWCYWPYDPRSMPEPAAIAHGDEDPPSARWRSQINPNLTSAINI